MADIEPTVPCTNCQHLASAHNDTDNGDNNGACTMANCTCPSMVTGAGTPVSSGDTQAGMQHIVTMATVVTGGSAAAPTPAAASSRIVTMADGDAPSGADPATLAQALDVILDQATAVIGALTFASLQPEEQSACALVNAASASVDMLLLALGATDTDDDSPPVAAPEAAPDPTAGVTAAAGALDPGQDSTSLAEATDAAIVAARDLFATIDTPSDGVGPIIALVAQADEASGQVLAALSIPDPDAEEGTDPDEADPDPADDIATAATRGSKTFADTPVPTAPAPTPTTPPTDVDGADAPAIAEDPNLQFTMPVMVIEGVDTGDGRKITPMALTWRDLPLSVMAMTETSEWGHEGAQLVGRLDTIERFDASTLTNPKTGEPYGEGVQALKATGTFASAAEAAQVAELVRGGFLTGVSVDVGDVVSILEITDDNGDTVDVDEEDIWDIMFMDGNMVENVTAGRVMGVTICPFPAFEGAYIEMGPGVATPAVQASAKPSMSHALNILDEFGARICTPCEAGMPLLASAGPMTPPKSWFEDPQLPGPTPLTITEDGRVYGHLAAWSTCHTGISGRCTTAPRSGNDYANFHVGALKTLDGDVISVGHVTMGTGHAGLNMAAGPAADHYDHTGSVAADVCVGEDKFGIWVSGATRPDLTELQLRQLRSAALSGDWRQIGRGLELVAALAVNVPGFPLPRARVASAATVALTAAGGRTLLNQALGSRNIELNGLRKWQLEQQPVLDMYINEKATQLRSRMMETSARIARERIHGHA